MGDFTIRPFRLRDLDQVTALEKACFPGRPYRRLDFLLLRSRGRSGFLVAEDDGRVLGYVIVVVEEAEGMIVSIAVSPQFRGRGIGEALLKYGLERLTGCERVNLLVDQKNLAAISLYRKHSFKETGRIFRGYYPNGNDGVEMMRAG